MLENCRNEMNRKCFKCGCSPAKDGVKLFRFPKPGVTNMIRCLLWAKYIFPEIEKASESGVKYCFPNKECSTKLQTKLHADHRMLCDKHFNESSFADFSIKKLQRDAVPEDVSVKKVYVPVQSPSEATAGVKESRPALEEVKEIKSINEALPTLKSSPLKPIEDVQVQDTPETTLELPSCSTTVENTDVCDCDDDDVADDDTDTLVESNVCRVCLAMDVKMYDLNNIELREMFQNITGIAVTENNHSILERLCWECSGRLKAAAAFRNKALLIDALLQGLASTGEQIRKNDITLIKENEDYLKSFGSLSAVEVFHIVHIDPENDSVPPKSENNDTEIVQNTVRSDSIKLKKSIIEEVNDQMDVEGESMIEAPITTEIQNDQFDHICRNTGEERSNIFLETNPVVTNNVPFREDKINSANSSTVPRCSRVEPKHPILGHLKTPSDFEDKIKKPVIKITKRDSISKIVLKKSNEVIRVLKGDAKLKNINVKIGGISKKTSKKTVRNDSIKLKKSIIEEVNDQMDVEDESMIEAPITSEMKYDQFDHIYCNTGEESSNIFLEINPVVTNNVPIREDKINSADSSLLPICSHVEPKHPILGHLLKTPSDFEDKIKKPVIKITKRDSISKIVFKNSNEVIRVLKGDANLKNINVKMGGIIKKTSNLKLVKKTQVKPHTPTDEERKRPEDFEF